MVITYYSNFYASLKVTAIEHLYKAVCSLTVQSLIGGMHSFLVAIVLINTHYPLGVLLKKIHITQEQTRIDVEKCTSPQDVLVFSSAITVNTFFPVINAIDFYQSIE